jgi:hypothetical protein
MAAEIHGWRGGSLPLLVSVDVDSLATLGAGAGVGKLEAGARRRLPNRTAVGSLGLRPSSRWRTRRSATSLSARTPRRRASPVGRLHTCAGWDCSVLALRGKVELSSRHVLPTQGGGPVRRRGELLDLRRTAAAPSLPLLAIAGTNRRVDA